MFYVRVENVERVEGGGKPQSAQRTQRVIWRWGFTPYPKCELIIRDSTLFGVWGKAPALKISSAPLRLCDSALKTFVCFVFFVAKTLHDLHVLHG